MPQRPFSSNACTSVQIPLLPIAVHSDHSSYRNPSIAWGKALHLLGRALFGALLPFERIASGKTLLPFALSAFLLLCDSAHGLSASDYVDYSAPRLPGRLYIPTGDMNSETALPLVLALHGGGGIGSDNARHLIDFNPLLSYAKANGAYLYLPQTTSAFWHLSNRPEKVMEMIDKVISERNVDPSRVYVTGFSMGGGGAWDFLKLYPDRFAGGIPIAGIKPRVSGKPEELLETPLWAFHARDDTVVSASNSRAVVDRLLASLNLPPYSYPPLGNRQITFEKTNENPYFRYTEWPSGGHPIWWRVYQSNETLGWLFDQRLQIPAVSIRNLRIENRPSSLLFEVAVDSTADLVLEQSPDLVAWTTPKMLKYQSAGISVEIADPDGFFRISLSD